MKIPHKSIIYGTVVLTGVSFLCRGIGFFYRTFISQTFGEESMGIYQLTAPVMSMAFSLCCAGFQTSISRYVAAKSEDENTSLRFLFCGLAITTALYANSREHFSCTLLRVLLCDTAFLTSGGLVLESSGCIEFLLTCGEHEIVATIFALQCLVLVHGFSLPHFKSGL